MDGFGVVRQGYYMPYMLSHEQFLYMRLPVPFKETYRQETLPVYWMKAELGISLIFLHGKRYGIPGKTDE